MNTRGSRLSNKRMNAPHSAVTALAQSSKRRAAGRARYAHRYAAGITGMASYKVLRGVAHSLGHSFTSLMHYRGNDYVMGHLLSRAREAQENRFVVDLVAGTGTPDVLLTPEVSAPVRRYSEWLRELVSRQGSDMRYVAAATLSVTFDLTRERRALVAPRHKESPYVCRVAITDDRGKVWHAEFAGWWFPEPGRPKPRRTWWAFWRPAA